MWQLEVKIRDKTAVIGIVGLGYVGLPLAVSFSEAGFKVIGFDIQNARVDTINNGKSYINDVSDQRITDLVESRLLEATTDQSRLRETDAISICVPTPLNEMKEPDLSYVINESVEISKYLKMLLGGFGPYLPFSFSFYLFSVFLIICLFWFYHPHKVLL